MAIGRRIDRNGWHQPAREHHAERQPIVKRSIVDGILALPLRWVDESVPVERIQAFLSAHAEAVKVNPAFSEMDTGKAADWQHSLPDGKPFHKGCLCTRPG